MGEEQSIHCVHKITLLEMYVFQKDFCPDLYLIQHVVLKFYLLPNIAIAYLSQPYK